MCCWIISPFYDFCIFRCVSHCMSPLTSIHVYTDVLYTYICCFITITKFLCWRSIMNYLFSTAMKTQNDKYFGVTILIFRGHVTSSERDHRTRQEHSPIDVGGQWWPCVYLARIRRYEASKILGSRVWPFGVTWRHRSRDHSTRHMWFPIGGPLEPCVYLSPLRRYKASKLHLSMLKAMRRVTWPVGRGSKITICLEFPSPHCLFTVQLLWRYDDD